MIEKIKNEKIIDQLDNIIIDQKIYNERFENE